MLICLNPTVPEVQATLHLLCSPAVSASMSHCAEISLSPGRSLLQAWEWAAGPKTRPFIFSARLRALPHDQGCGELFAHVTDVVSAACADRTQRMQPTSVLPAFICTYPPPLLLHFLPLSSPRVK